MHGCMMGMYVCVGMYIYIVYMHVYTCICMYVGVHVYVCVHVCVERICTCVNMYLCVHVSTCVLVVCYSDVDLFVQSELGNRRFRLCPLWTRYTGDSKIDL